MPDDDEDHGKKAGVIEEGIPILLALRNLGRLNKFDVVPHETPGLDPPTGDIFALARPRYRLTTGARLRPRRTGRP
ncbi:hypothetical protein, partial [Actinomadura sp. 7K534]|uniref:hypothetical protein n=1 Tax=Actinomadura sp. 7K534 TaxID=2530366 RepID=UPI001A9CD1D9